MTRLVKFLNDLLLLSEFLAWLDKSIDPAERVEGRKLLRRVLWRVAGALGLSGALGVYLLLTAGAAVTDDALVPGQETGAEINLYLPASPVDVQLATVACNAEAVEKAQSNVGVTYTAKHTTKEGASVFLRWTDGPGMIGQNAVVEVNGQTAYPEPDERTRNCLRNRAREAPATGGPR